MKDIGSLIKENAIITEAAMESIFSAAQTDRKHYEKLEDAVKYSVFSGGKRIRPFLTVEFYKAVTRNNDVSAALPYAAAIEFIHTSSLIHDDLPAMDNDDVRRGKPSNHKVFGEATAILAGDALLLSAFDAITFNTACSAQQNIRAVKSLAFSSGLDGMVGGQQIDLLGESVALEADTVLKMHGMKTGALIACACELGCIAADADSKLTEAAIKYGKIVGTTFQIIDDLLDTESSYKIGKTTGKDKKYNKSTFVSVYGIEGSMERAKKLTEEAKQVLSIFPDSEAKNTLYDLSNYLLERKK